MARPFDLDGRIKKALNAAIYEVACEVQDELQEYFDVCIDAFYEDYEPRVYRRNYLTYLASSGFKLEKNPTKTSDGYIAGICVDFSFMEEQTTLDLPYGEWVFNRTYSGIHGFTAREARSGAIHGKYPPRMSPSPKRMMHQKFWEYTRSGSNLIDGKMNKAIERNLDKYLK